MRVLDELRQTIGSHGPYERADQPDWDTVSSVLRAIDAFDVAHPGLIDKTELCPRCSKPTVLNGRYKDKLLGYWRSVCPACSEYWQGR